MQALSNIQWFTDLINDRHEKMACSQPRHMPAVEPSLFRKLKRKMTDTSYEVVAHPDEPVSKRIKEQLATPTHTAVEPHLDTEVALNVPAFQNTDAPSALASASLKETHPASDCQVATPSVMSPERTAKLQRKIEAHINLEILLKHQELRLIEQELGKCQVALEQLRRCSVVPYPGESGSPITGEQVTMGTGPALHIQPGFQQPQNPAPWGVTDGPYTRHYARWLLPDPQFDATPIETAKRSNDEKCAPIETRHTRGSIVERGPSTTSRTHRASLASKQQPVAHTAVVKDRQTPLLIKHPLTGEMVKLICKYCGKDNIYSVQGFLNHCRIAHEKNYESHGAAAIECGVPLDGTETLLTPTTNDTAIPINSSGRPLVHPLIMGDRVRKSSNASLSTPSTPVSPVSACPSRQFSNHSRPVQPSPLAQSLHEETFNFSAQTPRLSKLIQGRNQSCNLSKAVALASVRINLDDVESLEEEEEDDEEASQAPKLETSPAPSACFVKPEISAVPGVATRPIINTTAKPSRSTSTSQPATPSVITQVFRSMPSRQSTSQASNDGYMNVSPHTVDTIPGLMSDNDDEEECDYEHEANGDSDHTRLDVRVRVRGYNGDADVDEVMQDMDDHGEGSANQSKMMKAAGMLDTKSTPAPNAKRKRGRPSKSGATRTKGGR